MDTPIRHQPARVVPKPAEVKMEPVWIERPLGRRPEPLFVIHTDRRRAINRLPNGGQPIQVRPTSHQAYLAKLSRADHLRSLQNMFTATPLRAHLNDAIMSPA